MSVRSQDCPSCSIIELWREHPLPLPNCCVTMSCARARVAKLADARDLKCSPAAFTLYSHLLRCCNFSDLRKMASTRYKPKLRSIGHSSGTALGPDRNT